MINAYTRWETSTRHPVLRADELHIWQAPLDLPLEDVMQLQQVLSADEIIRARRFHFEKDRRHWIAARGILRLLLGNYLSIPPDCVRFSFNSYGKPFLNPAYHDSKLQFNLSHSGYWALYAICTQRQVGIDIELIRANLDYTLLANHTFSQHEYQTLQDLVPALQQEAFYNAWTRKEAYVKARGIGLSLPLQQFDVSLVPGEPPSLLHVQDDPAEPLRWQYYDLTTEKGYKAVVITEKPQVRLLCWQWHQLSGQYTYLYTTLQQML
ncbi:4'-phosphopantetheinyl transferase family protein [Dictyobacter kobayashii]|uniref:Uncharacterized protein n=1 Tax=Dictyobacter kobayashii TaxID=2014872 RepID=A0A402AVD7_9CHLR|nr:4'-phosphopantetheinyl transferase superfamily protein [Dictyobacter kobayashii]GCE23078.1 hypothetical protein KDK_68780 [Dictyobacter kobayashii]